MTDLKICRICLRTECKVYKFDRFQLKPYYEEVMAMKVNEKDGLPHYFCYECATMLHKFHKFKEKCYIGQNTLKEISWRGSAITYEAIYKIDRDLRQLKSNLDIIQVTKRVKTYITDENSETSDSEPESIKEDEEKDTVKNIEEQYVSEDSIPLADRDDFNDPESDPVDENSKSDLKLEAMPKVHEEKFENVEPAYEKPLSPKTVFVDVKKEVVTLKNEVIKRKKRSAARETDEYGLKKQRPSFAKKRTRFLDTSNWKKTSLSEEEAIKEFRGKSELPQYIAAAFKCADCFKGFSKEDMLKRHKQLRHVESIGTLECRFCHMRFKWDCHLRKHLRQHFTRYECLRCDLKCCLESTALMHEEYHNGVVKKCIHCDEEFKHSSTYYTHLRTHRSEYICTLCGASFVSPLGLHMHKKVKHIIHEIDSPDDDEEVNTFCDKCDIRFETRKAYEEHLFHSAMHIEGFEDKVDEISIPKKVQGKKLKAKITTKLKRMKPDVDVAPQRKTNKKIRRTHRKPTTCHQCGKHFTTQAACMKHHLAEHPRTSFFAANERHICEICGASLAPGSIAMHHNMHTREKMHPCETCGRAFHSTKDLKRHLVTHTGEKPYACTLCDKRFTQSNSMKLHYRTFHLKQPYPKRNRRKKKDDPPDVVEVEDRSSGSEESDESPPPPRAPPAPPPAPDHVAPESMHYLTLS